jgi:hypothetical protein
MASARASREYFAAMRTSSFGWLWVASYLGLLGCSSNGGGQAQPTSDAGGADAASDGAPAEDPACDPLVPTYCGFPFPSNYLTVADATTKTGIRISIPGAVLPLHSGKPTDPSTWAKMDGFSTGQNFLTHMLNASTTGLVDPDHIDQSVLASSKTVLMDADSGELIPHWVDIDQHATDDSQRAFMIRPAVRLLDAHRYIVAIRHVVDDSGAELPASPAFVALRDKGTYPHPSIEARRANYEDMFGRLAKAGIDRATLQLAWDATTMSRESHTDWMLKMRDEALATVGDAGPTYTVTSVTDNPNPDIRRRIEVNMHVPLYLTSADPTGTLNFGPDGLPKQNGFADFPVLIHVPNSALSAPAALVQNGHGLLGARTEGDGGYLTMIANKENYVAFAVDFVGMAGFDQKAVTNEVLGDIGQFSVAVGRQHQGLLNSLLAMRMMKGSFWKDPNVQFGGKSVIDPTQCFYRGDSQGGIFGGSYMALSTDVTRGLLSVTGGPYSILLARSQDFAPFLFLLEGTYSSGLDVQMALGLVQMLWDRTEPNGYLPYMTQNPLPGTPPHYVLLHDALGDHQVSPLGAHYEARSLGAKLVDPYVRPLFGIPTQTAPFMNSSALVEFDYGLPPAPLTDLPPDMGDDPHEWVRKTPQAYTQADAFFRTGTVTQTCMGACTVSPPM